MPEQFVAPQPRQLKEKREVMQGQLLRPTPVGEVSVYEHEVLPLPIVDCTTIQVRFSALSLNSCSSRSFRLRMLSETQSPIPAALCCSKIIIKPHTHPVIFASLKVVSLSDKSVFWEQPSPPPRPSTPNLPVMNLSGFCSPGAIFLSLHSPQYSN